MHTHPYRNDWIVTVIRDMFFVDRAASFAQHFRYLFPTYEFAYGQEVHEVPIAMVALVATAVSLYFSLHIMLTLSSSCTLRSTSGATAITKSGSSQQMHIWTCIKATWIHWTIFGRGVKVHSTLWCRTSIKKRSKYHSHYSVFSFWSVDIAL